MDELHRQLDELAHDVDLMVFRLETAAEPGEREQLRRDLEQLRDALLELSTAG